MKYQYDTITYLRHCVKQLPLYEGSKPKKLLLTSAGVDTVVDSHIFQAVSWMPWCLDSHGYVRNRVIGSLARFVVSCKIGRPLGIGEIADHINGNVLDNRMSNLRVVNKMQSNWNRKVNSTSKTGLKGVSYVKRSGKYYARISVDKQMIDIGYFADPYEAAYIYDQFALALHGEYARTNFL